MFYGKVLHARAPVPLAGLPESSAMKPFYHKVDNLCGVPELFSSSICGQFQTARTCLHIGPLDIPSSVPDKLRPAQQHLCWQRARREQQNHVAPENGNIPHNLENIPFPSFLACASIISKSHRSQVRHAGDGHRSLPRCGRHLGLDEAQGGCTRGAHARPHGCRGRTGETGGT